VGLLPFFDQGQDCFGVAFGGYFGEDVQQRLVGADYERGALNAPDFLPIHVLFLHNAKLIAYFLVYISKECVGQVVFGAEFGLGFGCVPGDAEDYGAGRLELLEGVAEAASLNGAARSVRSRVKEEYNRLACIGGEASSLVLVGLQGEVGNFLVEFHGVIPRMVGRRPSTAIRFDYSRGGRPMSLRNAGILSVKLSGVLLVMAALPGIAQYPGQVAKNSKENPELRSIAVLEFTGDEGNPKASRLVPVAVLDAGQLQDGGIYLARPEPLALVPEVEYELQEDGKPVGLFDIRNSGQEQGSWVGFGAWKPMPVPRAPSAKNVPKIDDDGGSDDQPVLHRKHHAGEKPASGSGSAGGSGSGGDSSGQAASSDPDRPTLHKKDSGSDTSGSGTGSSTGTQTGSASTSDPDRPVIKKGKKPQASDVGNVESIEGDTDPDRPRLRRGKSSGPDIEVSPSLMGFPPDLQQTVAVSDVKSHPAHPWDYAWSNPEDEAKMKSALEDMARDALGLSAPAAPAKPAPKRATTTTAKKTAKPAPPPPPPAPLGGEQFRVFELAYGSGATLVLSAHTDGPLAQQKFVTLVAQPDLYGNVLMLLKNVTDGAHLDEKPRMRLIDAVDALADNRGELLFELRGATQRQFALYRVLRGQAEKLFVSGGGEFAASASE